MNEVWHARMALSRVGARWSSPVLTVRIWPPGCGAAEARRPAFTARAAYPLACLVAVAVCAFTAAGNDRFTAVGQWINRAARQTWPLRAVVPGCRRYRAPDEKTIRVVLDRRTREP